jgi:hypothetical protein
MAGVDNDGAVKPLGVEARGFDLAKDVVQAALRPTQQYPTALHRCVIPSRADAPSATNTRRKLGAARRSKFGRVAPASVGRIGGCRGGRARRAGERR